MAETTQAGEAAARKSRTWIPRLTILAVLLVVAAGVAARFALRSSPNPAKKEASAQAQPHVKSVLHLENFVVNLADPEESRFLRVGIDLGLEDEFATRGNGKEASVSTAVVRDTILTVLGTWRSDALLAPDGKAKLKEELLRALHERAPELGTREVYFTDFLVQR